MFWPEENAVTVVDVCNITEPKDLQVKEKCQVKVGKSTYSGVVAAIGKNTCRYMYCAQYTSILLEL